MFRMTRPASIALAAIAAGSTAGVAAPAIASTSIPSRTCHFAMSSVTAGGRGGSTSSKATRDSCGRYYDAKAKCYRPNGTFYYSRGLWRFSTLYSSIAYCGNNDRLTKAWYGVYLHNTQWHKVYP